MLTHAGDAKAPQGRSMGAEEEAAGESWLFNSSESSALIVKATTLTGRVRLTGEPW